MGKQAFEDIEGRINGMRFDPYKVKIYGLDKDCPEAAAHLWVPDAKMYPSDEFVADIRDKGIETPIVVQKIGDIPVVVKGRSRVKAARLLKDEGVDITVPAMVSERGSTQAEIMASVISENRQRKKMNALDLAEMVSYFIKLNGRDDKAMSSLKAAAGLDERRLDKLMDLRSANKTVHEAIRDGDMDYEAAIAISEMPVDKQAETVSKLKAGNNGKKITTEQARAAKVGRYPRPPQSFVKRLIAKLAKDKTLNQQALDVMRYLNGEASDDVLIEHIKSAVTDIKAKTAKRKASAKAKAKK
jgi:hypothetical protein